MTKLFTTTALIAALAMPAFAAKPGEGETLAENQTLNFWILDAFKSLDPQLTSSRTDSDMIRQLFEGLLNEDETGAMVNTIAEAVILSALLSYLSPKKSGIVLEFRCCVITLVRLPSTTHASRLPMIAFPIPIHVDARPYFHPN